MRVPRVRGSFGEISLPSYEPLHRGVALDDKLFRRVLAGISCRDYEGAARDIPGALGLSKTTVSSQFMEASVARLKELQERDLSALDVVVIFLDGKAFADDQMVAALGITMNGDKKFLGFVQTDTENSRVLTSFLQGLLSRGLDISKGVLTVIDGGKGLRRAVTDAFGTQALVQRCQWHKRENVVSYLSKNEQPLMKKRLQRAYQQPDLARARKELLAIRKDLEKRNLSAMNSLDEGMEETLTLHRLGVFALLGTSLKTTNCIESVNAHAEQRCGKIDHWRNSSQKQRWFACALLDMEPRFRKIRGYKHLPLLREAIMKELKLTESKQVKKAS
jgi:putative transposase